VRSIQPVIRSEHILVWHDDQETLARILVRLQLVVGAVNASTAGQKQQELAGRMRVVGWLGDIGFDVIEFGHLLRPAQRAGLCFNAGAKALHTPVGDSPAATSWSACFLACVPLWVGEWKDYVWVCRSCSVPEIALVGPLQQREVL